MAVISLMLMLILILVAIERTMLLFPVSRHFDVLLFLDENEEEEEKEEKPSHLGSIVGEGSRMVKVLNGNSMGLVLHPYCEFRH